jgi:hypothetical protein
LFEGSSKVQLLAWSDCRNLLPPLKKPAIPSVDSNQVGQTEILLIRRQRCTAGLERHENKGFR